MKLLRSTVILITIALGVCGFSENKVEAVSKEQEIEIRRMMKITGMNQLLDQMIEQMLNSFKMSAPDVPAELWTGLRAEMKVDEVLELMLPLYAKYYSAEDLHAINNFYESPAGKRLLAKMPQLMHESMEVGQKWGQAAGERVAQKIQAEREAKKSAVEPQKTTKE